MGLVIGIGGKSAPGSGLSLAVRDGRPVVGLRELAPSGLAAADEPSGLEIADARARFEASGENAVAILGENRSWAIVEALLAGGGASGLLIYDDAADYIARRIANGSDLDAAAADWIKASSLLLRAADTCRGAARVVSSADIAASAEEFSYFCETQFGLPVESRASAPPPLELVIASQFVSTHEDVRSLAEELDARGEAFSGYAANAAGLGDAALARLLSLYEKETEIDALRKDCAALTEQLRLVQYKAETYFKAARGKSGSASGAESARLSAELEYARHEIAALRQSTSWKITAPVRFASRILKRGAGGKGFLAERRQLLMLRNSDLFDADWYCRKYPDVAATRRDPAKHFLRFGAIEKRSPSAKFDSEKYLKLNPDVAASGVNPLVHYLQYGRKEARGGA